jgi:hypothetical protein
MLPSLSTIALSYCLIIIKKDEIIIATPTATDIYATKSFFSTCPTPIPITRIIIPTIAWVPDPFWLTNISAKLDVDDDDDLYAIYYYS